LQDIFSSYGSSLLRKRTGDEGVEQWIQYMIEQALTYEHIRKLLENKKWRICLSEKEKRWNLMFQHGNIRWIKDEGDHCDLLIEGTTSALLKLVRGEEMLQQLMKKREIQVKGSYRALLFFESFAWLFEVNTQQI
jgi:ubiquinone biosynthesis protein UbiJ